MKSSPRILRKSLMAGAREARGVAVVIDVYRAFTSAALMTHLGAREILLLANPADVLRLKHEQGCLAVGEVDGIPVPGFDMGNSPSQIAAAGRALFAGRTVALRTSAGVTGAVAAAANADTVILGSFVTAGVIARHIRQCRPAPEIVSLVAMGAGGQEATPEDLACADYIEHLLTGAPYDPIGTLSRVIQHECTQKFLRGDQSHFPPADPLYCLQRDVFDFALVAAPHNGQLAARRVDVPEDRSFVTP